MKLITILLLIISISTVIATLIYMFPNKFNLLNCSGCSCFDDEDNEDNENY